MTAGLPALELRLLDAGSAPACAGMTFPAYRHLLALRPVARHPEQGDTRIIQPVGIVAILGGRAVGLALAETPIDESGTPELLSLFVVEPLRGTGIGTALVARLESELAALGFDLVQAVYMTGRASIAAVERILAKREWDTPAMRTLTVRFTPDEARTTEWYGRVRLPRGAEIVAWTEVTPEERQAIAETNAASPWIAEGLEPWAHDARGFDEVSSLGLRHRGAVVGWVINHRLPDGTTRFTCSFMRGDLARRAAILPLYTESIERVRASGGAWCMFITPVKYAEMIDFLRTRCASWVSFVGETRGVSKRLAPSGGAS